MESFEGQRIKGYDLIERVGSGSFGVVYRAYQETIGREVALKVILPGFANNPNFIRRFEAEAQLIARLEHLHIVPLYDYWREPSGAFLVMRWMRGGSLADLVMDGPLPLEEAASILDQVAAALSVAHLNHIVHRDLKPSNILMDEEGNAYLADFGIAMDLRTELDEGPPGGGHWGSLGYLSPEQARNEPVTPRTDLFSLGVTLYEMLAGEHPHKDLSALERMYKLIEQPLPSIDALAEGVGDEVNRVIQRATAKDPQERYVSAEEMATAFRKAARLDQLRPADHVQESLTLREQEILHLITEGHTNKQIAEKLFIEHSTVKWHIRQIYSKLDVRSRRQAIRRARDLELLVPGSASASQPQTEAATASATSILINPFKGLRAFETSDSHHYFGREALIERLTAHLDGQHGRSRVGSGGDANGRFLAIVGPSGSGKSSLIKAGLIPALWSAEVAGSDGWFIATMTPGERPLDELEVALLRLASRPTEDLRGQLERDRYGVLRAADLVLPDDHGELVLLIDQFEELFLLSQGESERSQFVELLTSAATDPQSRIRVAIALRADYYDRPLNYPQFGELVRSNLETVLPLSAEQLERAIVKPAETVGVGYEEGLVARIIDEVLYEPGALPLLQYALTELFERRDGRELTHEAYDAIGGSIGALARRAEELYREQDDLGQDSIRQLFLRLAALEEDPETVAHVFTRRRAPRSELTASAKDEDLMDELIDAFARYRLLTLDHDPATRRPTVEVAHEALLREWARLRRWLEDSREDLLHRRRLQSFAMEWSESEHDPGLLLRERRLDQFSAWAETSQLTLTEQERNFLEASEAARRDRRAQEEARRRHELETAAQLAETEARRAEEQAQANLRLRRLALGLAGVLVLTLASATLAWRQTLRAEEQTRIATARELAAASVSSLSTDPERSILLALESVETTYSIDESVLPEAEEALHRAVQRSRARLTLLSTGAVAYDPEGKRLATSSEEGAVVWDVATGEELLSVSGHTAATTNLIFSSDGGLLATAGLDGTARVWDAATGQPVSVHRGHEEGAISVALSPDGRRIAASGFDGTLRVWEIGSGEASHVLQHSDTTVGLAFSPDGKRLAVAVDSSPGEGVIWDMESGEAVLRLTGHGDGVNDIVFTPDGGRLITASTDGTARIWDAASGEVLHSMTHGSWVFGIDISRDGRLVATGGQDGIVKLWDAASGAELATLAGHAAGVDNVAISPDGVHLASSGAEGIAKIWDITPSGASEWLNLSAHDDLVFSVEYSPDGSRFASGSWDGTAKIWDADSGSELVALAGHTDRISRIDFHRHEPVVATSSYDGTARLWDASSGEHLLQVAGHEGWVFGVAFDPGGTRFATAGADGRVMVWDAQSGTPLREIEAHSNFAFRVNFSPDGSQLASAGWDGVARLWAADSGELLAELDAHEGGVNQAAYSPDGTRLVTASFDGSAKIWDLTRHEVLATLTGHTDTVWDAKFSPDGSRIATAGFEGLTKLWDVQSGSEILTLFGTVVGPELAFNPAGSRLLTGGQDGSLKVYVLPIEELLTFARSRVTRTWTESECIRYLHLEACPTPISSPIN